jgi:hypothetical protein
VIDRYHASNLVDKWVRIIFYKQTQCAGEALSA